MAQITLTLPDGNARQYDAGITAGDVANDISKSLGKKAISATVNGAHFDLAWPIDADADIAIHTMADEDQANELVRHEPCPHHGPRRSGNLARHTRHHRSGDQGRLVL